MASEALHSSSPASTPPTPDATRRHAHVTPQDAAPHPCEHNSLHSIPDEELLQRLTLLVGQSRRVEADLVAHIGEVEERRLFARRAFPSMYAYCTEALHLSEAEAYRRITVARAARRDPRLLEMLRDGRLHLSGMALIVSRLTPEKRDAVLTRATHRSKREIERLVAELAPRPDVRSTMRKLPQRRMPPVVSKASSPAMGSELFPGRVGVSAPRPATVEPLSPARYKVQFTASQELHDQLERLAALMRSEVPDGDLGTIIGRAVSEKLERLESRRFAKTRRPRKTLETTDPTPRRRHVPAAVRRAVRERDGNRCSFVDEQGRRCSERLRLEFHHQYPYGKGGDHNLGNICLLCRAHNRLLAEIDYGEAGVRRHLRAGDGRDDVAAVNRPESSLAPSSWVVASSGP